MSNVAPCKYSNDGVSLQDGHIVFRWCQLAGSQVDPFGCNECLHRIEKEAEEGMKYDPCPHARDERHLSTRGNIARVCQSPSSPLHNRSVSPIECKRCPIRLLPESSDEVPTLPSFPKRVLNYTEAVAEWITKGRPERSNEDVEHIYSTYCVPCSWLKRGTCQGCGCRVARNGVAVTNKIKMATQHCPQGKW